MSGDKATVVATTTAGGGLSTGGLLAVVFVALKLGGVVSWSWWWVLAPVWIPGTLVILLLVSGAIVYVVAGVAEARERERRFRERTGQPPRHGPARRWPR